jgi:hypothetical protein
MNTVYVLIVFTMLLWADGLAETFMNEFNYSTLEKCIAQRDYVERHIGLPLDGKFRAAHLGVCIEKKVLKDAQ